MGNICSNAKDMQFVNPDEIQNGKINRYKEPLSHRKDGQYDKTVSYFYLF